MKIYLIRHTSVAVKPGICYGKSDVALADSFEDEKKRVTALVENIHFGKIYSSPLARCRLLVEDIFENRDIVFDDRLKELNFGDWELKNWDAIYADPKGKVWLDNYQTLPTLNGESYPEMVERIAEFLDELKKERHENVVIVTHAGVIRILKSLIENKSTVELFVSFKPAYGSVTKFQI